MVNAEKFVPSLLESSKLEGSATYADQARTADKLLATPRLRGNFFVRNGTLVGVDLMSLLRGSGNAGKSSFTELTGAFAYESGRVQLRNMHIGAGLISANGHADMDENNRLSGNFAVNLKSPTMRMRSNMAVSGTLKQPDFHR